MPAAAFDAERRLEPEHLQRLGEVEVVTLGDAVVRVEVEGEVVGRGAGRVRPGDALAEQSAMCLTVSIVRSMS